MNIVLTDVLKQLDLQPGERRSVVVEDYCVVIQREEASLVSIDEPPLPGFSLDLPLSSRAVTLTVNRVQPQFPAPFEVTEADLAPE
jgi:hypothetical protein